MLYIYKQYIYIGDNDACTAAEKFKLLEIAILKMKYFSQRFLTSCVDLPFWFICFLRLSLHLRFCSLLPTSIWSWGSLEIVIGGGEGRWGGLEGGLICLSVVSCSAECIHQSRDVPPLLLLLWLSLHTGCLLCPVRIALHPGSGHIVHRASLKEGEVA